MARRRPRRRGPQPHERHNNPAPQWCPPRKAARARARAGGALGGAGALLGAWIPVARPYTLGNALGASLSGKMLGRTASEAEATDMSEKARAFYAMFTAKGCHHLSRRRGSMLAPAHRRAGRAGGATKGRAVLSLLPRMSSRGRIRGNSEIGGASRALPASPGGAAAGAAGGSGRPRGGGGCGHHGANRARRGHP